MYNVDSPVAIEHILVYEPNNMIRVLLDVDKCVHSIHVLVHVYELNTLGHVLYDVDKAVLLIMS